MNSLRQAFDMCSWQFIRSARVTQEFLGVLPGRVVGQRFKVGEIIEGQLAATAVNEGWAVAIREPVIEIKQASAN